ncbi:MAG: hypothetical protein ABJP66_01735 [Hyphomicrobiales bacterium]
MSLSFDSTYYQAQRPDVYNAFVATQGSTGLTWAAFAEQHYNTFGYVEGTNPTASFDTSYYLSIYTDVAAAGINPFTHFLSFGAAEMRVPFSTFPASSFVPADYAAANPDLAAAGLTTDSQLYEHWVIFGQFESRSGAPTVTTPNTGSSFVFTDTVGENLVGTTGDDTFTGILGTGANIQSLDTADGLAGNDTLTILVAGAAAVNTPTGFSSSNIENVFVQSEAAGAVVENNGTSLDATKFGGATAVWQVNDFATTGAIVGTGQTAGFKDGVALGAGDGDVTAAAGVTSVSVALDGVATASVVTVSETTAGGVSSATVSGSVGGAGALTVDVGGSTTALATVNLGLTSNGTVTLTADATILTTLDMSSSTGNLTIDPGATAFTKLGTITGGSGNDSITFDQNGTATVDLTVDGGAGNDTLVLADSATPTKLLMMTGGAGNDTFDINSLINVTDEANFADTLFTITDFDSSADVIDLAGVGSGRDTLTNTELANIAGAATLEAAIDLAAAATTATEVSVFIYGGNGYVLHNAAGAALADNDGLVQITGLTDVSVLNGTNFITA